MHVRWTEYALDQLQVVADELTLRRSPAVRTRIIDHILERIGALADLPWSAPPWRPANDDTFRRLVVDDYVILYRIVDTEDSVFILSLRHGRRRPLAPDDLPPA